MDAKARNEMNSIISDLNKIIRELKDISSGIKSDFRGIGQDRCASMLEDVAAKYQHVVIQLKKID